MHDDMNIHDMKIKHLLIPGLGIAVGGFGGFLYWYYVGCFSGACPITSSPVNSTIYGSVMGVLFVNMFKRDRKKTPPNDQPQNTLP